MALHPNSFTGQEKLQPGARGEIFQADLPGYRGGEDRINRTNNKLNTSAHDVPNIKYQFDYRLPVLFRYGFAYGFNQIVIPKGRIVAVDPFMDLVDFDMKKQHNTLTIANGGVPVKVRDAADKYPVLNGQPTDIVGTEAQGQAVAGVGKEWAPLAGFDQAYNAKAYRPFSRTVTDETTGETSVVFSGPIAQLGEFKVDPETGKVVTAEGVIADHVRPGNVPIGIMQRNEYTRDDDAYNGMMPGPVLTDALVELPWFTYKNKAEQNPWGSAYGGLFPGALVKSDENGRFVVSPLSFEEEVATMSVAEYEQERQQVLGQVYAVNTSLLPEGAAKWATWALEDRLKFNEFNPAVWSQNGRRGEDAISNSPYRSNGEYPGYPYDKAYKNSDLHMLASTGRLGNYDQRMNFEHQYENLGIPGLTDGKNVASRHYDPVTVGHVNKAGEGKEYVDMYFRTIEVDVENLQISFAGATISAEPVTVVQDALLLDGALKVKYVDQLQGIVVLAVADKAKMEAAFGTATSIEVKLSFDKRGLAGVPTFLDWDGVVGSVKVLLTK
ncbi:hypothetical protein [Heyndrickxia sporothermodurans]|uniref:hypothetical protein n=1 Tax=Heyndrickxia sporothermodurans TaxID=46224 RepID=UPI000D369782|nr:hypothetical protein [Heyndrickxia sporothermodurans]PTY92894.1 hypothetical protein B5V90_02110 [Heyndrickxia sporothermodurans]